MRTALDIDKLIQEAAVFAEAESLYHEPTLYGVTDGKAIGTYLEHKFKLHLNTLYTYEPGNSASGIDFPGLPVDLKVTGLTRSLLHNGSFSLRQHGKAGILLLGCAPQARNRAT